jgi:hypothetical protein
MRYFLTMWDEMGIECLQDITDEHPDNHARAHLFTAIKNSEPMPKSQLGSQVQAMLMRARFNSQRQYEIYVFTAEDDFELDDINRWVKDDLQGFVDWVRKNHAKKLFSNYTPNRKQAIT